MIMVKSGGAIKNKEWLSEWAAPSIANSWFFCFLVVNETPRLENESFKNQLKIFSYN
jgi:hypothetical protein